MTTEKQIQKYKKRLISWEQEKEDNKNGFADLAPQIIREIEIILEGLEGTLLEH